MVGVCCLLLYVMGKINFYDLKIVFFLIANDAVKHFFVCLSFSMISSVSYWSVSILFHLLSTGDWTQGCTCPRRALSHLAPMSPSLFLLWQGLANVPRLALNLVSFCLSLQSSSNYRRAPLHPAQVPLMFWIQILCWLCVKLSLTNVAFLAYVYVSYLTIISYSLVIKILCKRINLPFT